MTALTSFCEQHPLEVVLTPFGLFPTVSESDLLWRDRMDSSDLLVGLDAMGTIRMTARCMNALYRLQALQQQAMARLVDLSQSFQLIVTLRDE